MQVKGNPAIRYRTFGGGGPKVVLLHGGMQSSLNFGKLAAALTDRFTVRRVTLPGVGHLAADDRGRPELVAEQLRSFFGG
jgi:pimeloyl-ACP methyl ester carboxylesterase